MYKTFKEFYPFYLGEHSLPICRLLHFVGTSLALGLFSFVLYSRDFRLIPLVFISGYFFAWIGHFVFEKNRPATFKYPVYSFMGDFVMFKDILIGKISVFKN